MKSMQVGVTGANGFVGQALCQKLLEAGIEPLAITRKPLSTIENPTFATISNTVLPTLTDVNELTKVLKGCDALVHLAARTHVLKEETANPETTLAAFRHANVGTTTALAQAAVAAGIKRFVYLSSIKVNGEATHGKPFTANAIPHPEDAYGVSKYEAERQLAEIADNHGLEYTIIRAPLIYGSGEYAGAVKGNLANLRQAVERGIPLPLKSIQNRRDLVSLANLCRLIICCLEQPKAAGQTFLAADGIPRTSADIVRLVATSTRRKPRLLPCPPSLLKIAGILLGKQTQLQRLLGDLEVDNSHARDTLGWHPKPPDTPIYKAPI